MPIDPKHLLELAKRLVGPTPGAVEADLRRGVSTAYYALFHLLIKEITTGFVSDPGLRPKVARALQHGLMKEISTRYSPDPNKQGQFVAQKTRDFPERIIDPDVRKVAAAFVTLHQAREKADYDDGIQIQHAEAMTWVQEAESAFQAWLVAQADPSSVS